jgi:iron complex outermembrane receptor protein
MKCAFYARLNRCKPGFGLFSSLIPVLALQFSLLGCLYSQQTDTLALQQELTPVTVSASRLEVSDDRNALATTLIGAYRLQRSQQQLALDEMLGVVPGLFSQNGSNFSQDVRVSIRGYGSRAAFGIRGIKLILDGFPETSPDGQGQVDNIDPAILNSVMVIRGSTAALYGNASGGQISFSTLNFDAPCSMEAAASLGSFGFGKLHVKSNSKRGKWASALNLVRTQQNGYREHSAFQNYLVNTGLRFQPDSLTALVLALNAAYSPEALDPGALTLAEVAADRRAARARNLAFFAGERLWQGRLGLTFSRTLDEAGKITARVFQTRRSFSNQLAGSPAEIVQLDRVFSGASTAYTREGKILGRNFAIASGIEFELQSDERKRYINEAGKEGALLFDQNEQCRNLGVFISGKYEWNNRLFFFPGIRLDAVSLQVADNFITNGDDSGERAFIVFNPILGLNYSLASRLNIYTSLGRGFETPTFTEFAHPQGLGGFNPNLTPQRSLNMELGIKGSRIDEKLKFDAAIFYIHLTDELIAQESSSRVYYKNAGISSRKGFELSLAANLGKGIYAFCSYSYSDFRYRTFSDGNDDFNGNFLPGIPRHNGFVELRYFKSSGLYLSGTSQFVSSLFTSDLNDAQSKAYALANFRTGYIFKGHQLDWEPFFGINNVFNVEYYANIRTNGFSGRYYEPAAGIHIFGGLRVRFVREKE